MPTAGQRTELIVFQRSTPTEDESGGQTLTWATYATRRARVRFGTAQEKREAAQEGGLQTATFECVSSPTLRAVTLKDRISYIGASWDIVETAPLDRQTIRFTATRVL
jgi:SPP1 family predicted phage head-tail adaptor